mmetsp:Transcript_51581/g.144863  ORF Transcript_51581/g.144863 Transcript_51581/m.144863 type:complete len:247 (+) Transcript_51581:544-1284(+)
MPDRGPARETTGHEGDASRLGPGAARAVHVGSGQPRVRQGEGRDLAVRPRGARRVQSATGDAERHQLRPRWPHGVQVDPEGLRVHTRGGQLLKCRNATWTGRWFPLDPDLPGVPELQRQERRDLVEVDLRQLVKDSAPASRGLRRRADAALDEGQPRLGQEGGRLGGAERTHGCAQRLREHASDSEDAGAGPEHPDAAGLAANRGCDGPVQVEHAEQDAGRGVGGQQALRHAAEELGQIQELALVV